MKKALVISALALTATQAAAVGQLGLGANMMNGTSYGSVGYYDAKWDASLGFATSNTDSDAMGDSSASSLVLEGRYKMPLADNLKMTFGGLYSMDSGKKDGTDIDTASKFGVSIGLETNLTDQLMLGGYYFPVMVTSVEYDGGAKADTTAIGSVIQLKATYLLDLNF